MSAGPGGKAIFAGPDAPEVYFPCRSQNRTRFLFNSVQDPVEYHSKVQSLLVDSAAIKVAELKDEFDPSSGHLLVLRQLVVFSFPYSRKIGSFTVYWRP